MVVCDVVVHEEVLCKGVAEVCDSVICEGVSEGVLCGGVLSEEELLCNVP